MLFSTIFIFTSFIIIEVLLRILKYRKTGKWELFAFKLERKKKYSAYQPHTYLGYAKAKNVTNPRFPSNNAGFAGSKKLSIARDKKINTVRIFVCGGSNVEQNDYDMEPKFNPELTWPKSIENNLNSASLEENYEVINAGCSGYTILESTIHFLTKCLPYRPDYAVLYQGINDAWLVQAAADFSPDYTHARKPPVFPSSNGVLALLPNIRISFIYQYSLSYLIKFFEKPSDLLTYISCEHKYSMKFDKIKNAVKTYEDYLRSFCHIALAHNTTPILIPYLYNKELVRKPPNIINWDKEQFIELLEMNREATRRIADEIDGTILLELSDNEKDNFRKNDWIHFSKVGIEKLGKNVSIEILRMRS